MTVPMFGILRRQMRFSDTLIALCFLVASGCTVGPNYKPPTVSVLNEYGEIGREPTTQAVRGLNASKIVSGSRPVIDWWRTFRDPTLDQLIERAFTANLDVQRAGERLREARAQRGVVGADLFPEVDADGTYQHAHVSKNGLTSAFSGNTPVNAGGGGGQAAGGGGSSAIPGSSLSEFDLYQASFDASWEIDIFGGRRRAIEAADATVQAAVEDRRDVIVSMLGEVARNYLELRMTQRRLDIARNNLESQTRTLKVLRERSASGLSNELDSNRQQAQVATTTAQIPLLEINVGQAIHRLSVLIDERPTALAGELSGSRPLPVLPDEIPIGLPSDLLRRRADVRRAERRLAAATAQVGVSTADLFPKFNLTGSLGLQSTEPGNLVEYGSRFYSIAPAFSWPIFDAGRIRSRIKVSEARQAQSMIDFRQAVLTALSDVEDALLSYSKTQERVRTLRDAAVANERSVRIAVDLYQNGVGDFIDVLDAQRELYSTQDALAVSEGDLNTSLIQLYKAIGGGWEVDLLRQMQVPADGEIQVQQISQATP